MITDENLDLHRGMKSTGSGKNKDRHCPLIFDLPNNN